MFVLLASLTIVGPVVYYLVGGDKAAHTLDDLKTWLGIHNDAVMTVLLLVFGVDLIAKGLGVLAVSDHTPRSADSQVWTLDEPSNRNAATQVRRRPADRVAEVANRTRTPFSRPPSHWQLLTWWFVHGRGLHGRTFPPAPDPQIPWSERVP